VTAAYRLFGLIPDTLNIHTLMLALYSEQVAGYYEPDSATPYIVQGAEPGAGAGWSVAHELVHALQGQYVPLDSLLSLHGGQRPPDRGAAVMEGQATLASVVALFSEQDIEPVAAFPPKIAISSGARPRRCRFSGTAPRLIRETPGCFPTSMSRGFRALVPS